MEEKELIIQKNKKMTICKISTFILLGLAFVLIGLMVAWLLVRKSSPSASLVLSIICGVLILGILAICVVYYINKKQADQIQNDIDNT